MHCLTDLDSGFCHFAFSIGVLAVVLLARHVSVVAAALRSELSLYSISTQMRQRGLSGERKTTCDRDVSSRAWFGDFLADPEFVRDGSGTSSLGPQGRFRAPGNGF